MQFSDLIVLLNYTLLLQMKLVCMEVISAKNKHTFLKCREANVYKTKTYKYNKITHFENVLSCILDFKVTDTACFRPCHPACRTSSFLAYILIYCCTRSALYRPLVVLILLFNHLMILLYYASNCMCITTWPRSDEIP